MQGTNANENENENVDFTGCSIHTPEFTLSGFNTTGRLVDIIDGDSVSIILPMFNNFYKYHIRLSGIDTCEMRSKNEKCKNLAIKARDTLLELVTRSKTRSETRHEIRDILDRNVVIVFVKCLDFDKNLQESIVLYSFKNADGVHYNSKVNSILFYSQRLSRD